jgi:adenylate cyclase
VVSAIRVEGVADLEPFGVIPQFRIGVHGGDVVVSEQGDVKRSIGIYRDMINIAARMEEAAKAHAAQGMISGPVVKALPRPSVDPLSLGDEMVRGIVTAIPIFKCRRISFKGAAPKG